MESLRGKHLKVTSSPWLIVNKKMGHSTLYPHGAKFCHHYHMSLEDGSPTNTLMSACHLPRLLWAVLEGHRPIGHPLLGPQNTEAPSTLLTLGCTELPIVAASSYGTRLGPWVPGDHPLPALV